MEKLSIEELRKQIKKEKEKVSADDERKGLEKELFDLKHRKKIATVSNLKGNLTHMGKNAIAMVKNMEKSMGEKKQQKGKKSKNDDEMFGSWF